MQVKILRQAAVWSSQSAAAVSFNIGRTERDIARGTIHSVGRIQNPSPEREILFGPARIVCAGVIATQSQALLQRQ